MHRQRVGSPYEVVETTGSGNKNIASLAQSLGLLADWASAINDARSKHRSVAELTSLVEDLRRELASRGNDHYQRLSANASELLVGSGIGARGRQLLCLSHELIQDGYQVGGSLSRSCSVFSQNAVI